MNASSLHQRHWRDVLGLTSFERSLQAIEARYLDRMRTATPAQQEELRRARATARRELQA